MYSLDSVFDVVLRVPMLDVGPEKRPERPPTALVRHADASGVDDAEAAREATVVLHVRVAADDNIRVDLVEDRDDLRVGRVAGVDRLVRGRRRMAEEDAAEAVDL